MNSNDRLQYYIKAFSNLNVNRAGGYPSPHKPLMLLTALELAVAGLIPDNRMVYSQPLTERLRSHFEVVKRQGDTYNLYFPFFGTVRSTSY